MTKRESSSMILRDGRRLAFTECGAADGRPIVYFHGAPGSRLEGGPDSIFAAPLAAAGIRLVAIDRPGYGASSPHPGRRVVDLAADVMELLDHLRIDRAAVIGWSAGGPHALAAAACHPDRIVVVGIVAGLAPITNLGLDDVAERPLFDLAHTDPTRLRAEMTELASAMRQDPFAATMGLLEGALTEDDVDFATEPAVTNIILTSLREAAQQDLSGYADDLIALRSDWGFDLIDVAPSVHIIHGRDDLVVPIAHGRHLAAHLPTASILELDAGHLSVLRGVVDLATVLRMPTMTSPS